MPYKNKKKQRAYIRAHYYKNKKSYLSRSARRRKEKFKWFYLITKGIFCSICKESSRCCLDFHHVDPKTKIDTVAMTVRENRSSERILNEMMKCAVVCSNCHRKIHAGKIRRKKFKTWTPRIA